MKEVEKKHQEFMGKVDGIKRVFRNFTQVSLPAFIHYRLKLISLGLERYIQEVR